MSEKTTLVLIHGLLGSLRFFEPEKYLTDIRVLTPDLFGYGESALKEKLSLQHQVDFVKQVTEDIQEPFWILGHSVGGAIANLFASQYPHRVQGIINVEGNYSLKDAFWCQSISEKSDQEWKEEYQSICDNPKQWLEDSNIATSSRNLTWSKEILSYQDAETVQAVAKAIVRETASSIYQSTIQTMIENKTPIHLIAGEYSIDGWDIPTIVKESAIKTHIMPNTGHMMMLEEPEAFCDLIKHIIRDLCTKE